MGQTKSKIASPKNIKKELSIYGYSWQVNRNPPRLKTRDEINVQDFIIKGRKDETIVRVPGTIDGQQFIIDGCENCDFYVMDFCAEVSVDDCKNCRFFIGPVEGSFFIRNCENSKVTVACRQLRTRDCKNIDLILYAQGRPVIESSTNVRFGCFDVFYVGLSEQFKNAQLSIFNNKWNVVHDFTPAEGGALNYSYIHGAKSFDHLKPLHKVAPEFISEQEEELNKTQRLVPLTTGNSDPSIKSNTTIIFLPGKSDEAMRFLQNAHSQYQDKFFVSNSKEWKFSKTEVDQIFANSAKSEELKHAKQESTKGPIIVLAIVEKEPGTLAQCVATCASEKSFYITQDGSESDKLNHYVFNTHTVET
ncbi:hypothetical protein AKO1_014280 [Acrasis kona]|uniref:Protein XRP2 n=1 Tax=Acrasis kona TaxID=1008807 RepID=A0AAW2YZV9_9EUKA